MIAIFTPTYNRKELLKRCYMSLAAQTDKNFEWLVIDDGSTDDTKDYINSVRKKSDFEISYYYQKNGGKYIAFNCAVKECKLDYMLLLDSDDMLTESAIEILNRKCKMIKNLDSVCGIIGNCGHIGKNGVVGSKIPRLRFASGLDLYQRMNFHGDTMRLYKTSVLKKYPFPEINGEKFMPENVIFDRIDQKYKMLVIPEVLYLCEYQKSGLSNNIDKVRIENPIGYSLSLKSTAETALSLKKKFGVTVLYIIWCRKFGIKKSFNRYSDKVVYLLCWPVSFIMQICKRPRFFYNMFEAKNGK